jgi:hypothetical protein
VGNVIVSSLERLLEEFEVGAVDVGLLLSLDVCLFLSALHFARTLTMNSRRRKVLKLGASKRPSLRFASVVKVAFVTRVRSDPRVVTCNMNRRIEAAKHHTDLVHVRPLSHATPHPCTHHPRTVFDVAASSKAVTRQLDHGDMPSCAMAARFGAVE